MNAIDQQTVWTADGRRFAVGSTTVALSALREIAGRDAILTVHNGTLYAYRANGYRATVVPDGSHVAYARHNASPVCDEDSGSGSGNVPVCQSPATDAVTYSNGSYGPFIAYRCRRHAYASGLPYTTEPLS